MRAFEAAATPRAADMSAFQGARQRPEHRGREIDPSRRIALPLVGYSDRLSGAPGETIRFMVSSEHARYRARLVRLIHGDTSPNGPGFKQVVVPSDPWTRNAPGPTTTSAVAPTWKFRSADRVSPSTFTFATSSSVPRSRAG